MSIAAIILACGIWAEPQVGQWNLAEHFDRVLAYDGLRFREFSYSPGQIGSPGGGLVKQVLGKRKKGEPRPFHPGAAVGGQTRPGQLIFSGESSLNPAVLELVVEGGTRLEIDYGLADYAVEHKNSGTRLEVRATGGNREVHQTLSITENRWATQRLALPPGATVLVRLSAARRGNESCNWSCVVVRGDGRLGTRQQARQLSPARERIGKTDTLRPSPHRVTARQGYDILFYRDRPWVSYAVKGYPHGSHEQQKSVGVNTYYNEGLGFSHYWKEGTPGVSIPSDSAIHDILRLCQEFDLPFKCPVSMAHCAPFLPPWLVQREKLAPEGHKMRRGGDTHTSLIKAATLRWHKAGLDGWVKPLLDQPALMVLGQEEDASGWDDYSAEAVASWRAWLAKRFAGRWEAFSSYVGEVRGFTRFGDVPQPARFEPDQRFGYPMRLAYLKLQWITESYGDYMGELLTHLRKIAPGVPLTQRYVNWPAGSTICRRLKFDYNYSYGHLSVEGLPNGYGMGKKPWSGIYAHCATLPLPRGGSIGKAYSVKIRRGEMNEQEWRTNAYTLVANGCSGFEYSTLTPSWGPQWERSALMDRDFHLTPTGQAGQRVMKEVLAWAPYMLHYECLPDVAVFHDASFNTRPFGGAWSQSKVGLYALIRENGFHADPLSEAEMTAQRLRGRKVLVLGGTLSIAPEIQEAIRQYVRDGGVLVAVFCADAAGFPGANGYDYAVSPRESAKLRSFERPAAAAHLGDVLGIREGAGLAQRQSIRTEKHGEIRLAPYDALVAEKRWVDKPACVARWVPYEDAKILARFDDGSPAAIEHAFGRGRAITLAADLGIIANNITLPAMYRWWSDLLAGLGCRKAVETGNPWVEAGAWHDDAGRRVVFLVNHDSEHAQTARLPNGQQVDLKPGEALGRGM